MKNILLSFFFAGILILVSCNKPMPVMLIKTEIIGTGDVSDTATVPPPRITVLSLSMPVVDTLTAQKTFPISRYKVLFHNDKIIMHGINQTIQDETLIVGQGVYMWKDATNYYCRKK